MRIETERLTLRPLGVDDLEHYLELHREPTVVEFLGPATPAVARERLELCQRMWQERGHDLVAMIERSSGRFVGRTGLRYWPQFNETEVGWVLHRTAWGQGYATEAASAVIDWGFETLAVPYITAMIRPDNGRSLSVARRLGLAPLRDDSVYAIPVTVHATSRQKRGADRQPDEVAALLDHVSQWAQAHDDVIAVGASGTSAVPELVLISRDAARFPDAEQWAGRLGGATVVASTRRGAAIDHRLRTPFGLELQVTIAPVPPPVRLRALYDPEGILPALTDVSA